MAARRLDEVELTKRFGHGPEENPFIPRRGIITGGRTFLVFALRNPGPESIRVKDLYCLDPSGRESGSWYKAEELRRYWAILKMYEAGMDAKMDIVGRECLEPGDSLKTGAEKLAVFASGQAFLGPQTLVVEYDDGRMSRFEFPEATAPR